MIHNEAETVKTINGAAEGKLLKPVFVQELYSASELVASRQLPAHSP